MKPALFAALLATACAAPVKAVAPVAEEPICVTASCRHKPALTLCGSEADVQREIDLWCAV